MVDINLIKNTYNDIADAFLGHIFPIVAWCTCIMHAGYCSERTAIDENAKRIQNCGFCQTNEACNAAQHDIT